MAKGVVIGIIIAVIVIVAGVFLIGIDGDNGSGDRSIVISDDGAGSGEAEIQVPAGDGGVDEMIVDGDEDTGGATIRMTADGFSPSDVTINVGETVTFTSDGANRWPASNVHPTHTIYPGSSIGKCGGPESDEIFDACASVSEYSFTFNEAGTWDYHDHFSPGKGGTITVE